MLYIGISKPYKYREYLHPRTIWILSQNLSLLYNNIMKEKSPLIQTIKKVMPTVVSIVISKKLDDLAKEIPELYSPYGSPHLNIPPDKIDAHGMVQIGGGSGFIVEKNGTILTNKHVIADPNTEHSVILNDGRKFKARVLARDPLDDVAILKIG